MTVQLESPRGGQQTMREHAVEGHLQETIDEYFVSASLRDQGVHDYKDFILTDYLHKHGFEVEYGGAIDQYIVHNKAVDRDDSGRVKLKDRITIVIDADAQTDTIVGTLKATFKLDILEGGQLADRQAVNGMFPFQASLQASLEAIKKVCSLLKEQANLIE